MKIATRLKCSSYGSVGVMLIFLPLLAWSLARTDTLTHHDHLVDEIQLNAYERITFSDDYILYQTDRSKAQWLSATEKVGSLLKKASATLSGKQERQVLAEMQENFDDTVAIFGRIIEEAGRLARSGDMDFHHSDLGKRLSTQLVVKNSTFQGETYRLQKLTERNLEQANRRSVFFTSLFIFLIAVSTGLNSFFLNRVMHRRLEALHSGAKTIAGGNLNFRIGDCGRDEFGDLAATINLMTAMVAESREELEKYARKLIMVEEDLRRDVAHELHEEIAQSLAAMCMNLDAIGQWEKNADPKTRSAVEGAKSIAKDVVQSVRNLMVELRPAQLDFCGLAETVNAHVEAFEQKTGIAVKTDIEHELHLPPKTEIILFRIIQEALHNVARHSGATRATLHLNSDGRSIVLCITDNGKGFVVENVSRQSRGARWGLTMMRERAEIFGGTFHLHSSEGAGTSIMVEIGTAVEQSESAL